MRATEQQTGAIAAFAEVMLVALWVGLVTGLVEGAGFLVFQLLGWLNWNRASVPVSVDILWAAPLIDVLLFVAAGLALALLSTLVPRLVNVRIAFLAVAVLMLYDWMSLSGHLYRYAHLIVALGGATALARWFQAHEQDRLRFMRRSLPAFAAFAVLLFAGVETWQWAKERAATNRLPAAVPGTPNVLLLVVDTLRADHLSTYGYARRTSPNIDDLARQGVLFERAFSASSWTQPSHASLVTGRYTYEHDAERHPLDSRFPTIGETLSARGYRTGAFSGNVYYFNRFQGFGRGFVHFEDFFESVGDMFVRTLYGREARKYLFRRLGLADVVGRKRAEDLNRSATRWIEGDRTRPFFAFINYLDVHDPYVPPQPYRSRFSKTRNPGGILRQDLVTFPHLSPEQLQSEIDAYDGAIAYVDDQIGQLIQGLRQRGLMENTVVIVTADHGESFGEHQLFLHQNSLYWEVVHVPLILVQAKHIPAGVREDTPVSNVAIPDTIMELVGANDQPLFPQVSLDRLWRGSARGRDWPSPLSELAQVAFGNLERPSRYGSMKSLVSGDWHYTTHEKFGIALYDRKQDPGELENLATKPELQEVVRGFSRQIEALPGRRH